MLQIAQKSDFSSLKRSKLFNSSAKMALIFDLMQPILLIDLPYKDSTLIKSLKSELFELLISLSLRKAPLLPIYVLYPDYHKCIHPPSDPSKGLCECLSGLNEVRFTEEREAEMEEMQAQAGICLRALLSVHKDCKVVVLTNCRQRWSSASLEFARQRLDIAGTADKEGLVRQFHALLETCSPHLTLQGVLTFEGADSEIPLRLTPALSSLCTYDLKPCKVSLYVVDVLISSSIELQLCYGVAWLGLVEEAQGVGLMQDLQGKGLCLFCSSGFGTDAGEVRPWPSYYVCLPSEVSDGTFLLKPIAVQEHLRCIDRPSPHLSLIPRDLSDWVLSRFPAKLYHPRNYSNAFFKYTTDQSLAVRPATVPASKQEGSRVEAAARPISTLDKLASMFESVSIKKPGRRSGGKPGQT